MSTCASCSMMRRTLCTCMRLLSGLPRRSSRRPSWMRYELGGSWPCASQPAESEPSLSGMCCGAWLDVSWLRLSPPNSSKLVNPSSLGSARELELRRSPVSYALQPGSTRVPRCCRSMQLGHSTMCPGVTNCVSQSRRRRARRFEYKPLV